MTRDEASRNFIWRIAGMILRAIALRNKSIDSIERALQWPEDKLESFLINAVLDKVTDDNGLTLKDLAHLMYHLDMDAHITWGPIPAQETPPVFIVQGTHKISGRGLVHVGVYPDGCKGVGSTVMVNGKPRKIASIELQGDIRPGVTVGLIFHSETAADDQ